jgi:hypothetical protein
MFVQNMLDHFEAGANLLETETSQKLSVVEPWANGHNVLVQVAARTIMVFTLLQIIIFYVLSRPKLQKYKSCSHYIWLSNYLSLALVCFIASYQSQYSSVNHDMCVLFDSKTADDPVPEQFIPSNLQDLVDVCIDRSNASQRTIQDTLALSRQFRLIDDLAVSAQAYVRMPDTTNTRLLRTFATYCTQKAADPVTISLVNDGSAITQPAAQLAVIADYTNALQSRAASTCDSARDFIVLDLSECPSDANVLEDISTANARILLGQKCCLVLGNFNSDFWNARYSTDSFPCRRARANIAEYVAFENAVQDP